MNDAAIVERELGEILRDAARLYGRHLVPLILISALALPLDWLWVQEIAHRHAGTPRLVTLAQFLVGSLIGGALVVMAADAIGGRSPSVVRSMTVLARRGLLLVISEVMVVVLALASLVGLPYFFVRWEFVSQEVMLEGESGWGALSASARVVAGQWWRTAGIIVTILLIASSYTLVRYVILTADPALRHPLPYFLIWIPEVVFTPFAVLARTLLYYDLRARARVWEAVPAAAV